MGLTESIIAAAVAGIPVAIAELKRRRRRRLRRAGKLRTRAGDWSPRSSGAAVWLTDDDLDLGERPENGDGAADRPR